MTNGFTIRPYHARDEAGVLVVWNSALFADPINATTFRAKVLIDPNFDRETCLIAEKEGEVAGFVLGLRRRVPFFGDGYEPDQSWISTFGVAPQHQGVGIGSALLEQVLARLASLGAKSVAYSPYVPNYFTPGADAQAFLFWSRMPYAEIKTDGTLVIRDQRFDASPVRSNFELIVKQP